MPSRPQNKLEKALFSRAFQVALRCTTSLVARNQVQPVLIDALFDTQQRFSGFESGSTT